MSNRLLRLRHRRRVIANLVNPLSDLGIDWHTAFWADDPLWANPGDGGAVGSWRNGGSGDFGDATQATGANKPTFRASVAALNDRGAVEADGTDDALDTGTAGTTITQPNTVVAVGRYRTLTGTVADVLYSGSDSAARNQLFVADPGGTADLEIFAGTSVDTGRTEDTSPHLWTVVFNGASSTVEVDGTDLGALSSPNTQGLDGMLLFNSPSGSFYGTADLAFLGVVDGTLTAQQLSDLEAWAGDYYGLTIA